MSVMPLPHFQTVHLHNGARGVMLDAESLSIGQLGRLHFDSHELLQIERFEKLKEKEKTKMAFQLIDLSTLPVREFGRRATEPRISITENGRFQYNKLVQTAWEDVTKAVIYWDPDGRRLAFKGLKETEQVKNVKQYMKVTKGAKDGSLSSGGSGILADIKYDFAKAGNQSYEAKLDEKTKMYVITIPAETPIAKVKTPRKKKEVAGGVVTANGVNGAVVNAPVEAPAEEDLLEIS